MAAASSTMSRSCLVQAPLQRRTPLQPRAPAVPHQRTLALGAAAACACRRRRSSTSAPRAGEASRARPWGPSHSWPMGGGAGPHARFTTAASHTFCGRPQQTFSESLSVSEPVCWPPDSWEAHLERASRPALIVWSCPAGRSRRCPPPVTSAPTSTSHPSSSARWSCPWAAGWTPLTSTRGWCVWPPSRHPPNPPNASQRSAHGNKPTLNSSTEFARDDDVCTNTAAQDGSAS